MMGISADFSGLLGLIVDKLDRRGKETGDWGRIVGAYIAETGVLFFRSTVVHLILKTYSEKLEDVPIGMVKFDKNLPQVK